MILFCFFIHDPLDRMFRVYFVFFLSIFKLFIFHFPDFKIVTLQHQKLKPETRAPNP